MALKLSIDSSPLLVLLLIKVAVGAAFALEAASLSLLNLVWVVAFAAQLAWTYLRHTSVKLWKPDTTDSPLHNILNYGNMVPFSGFSLVFANDDEVAARDEKGGFLLRSLGVAWAFFFAVESYTWAAWMRDPSEGWAWSLSKAMAIEGGALIAIVLLSRTVPWRPSAGASNWNLDSLGTLTNCFYFFGTSLGIAFAGYQVGLTILRIPAWFCALWIVVVTAGWIHHTLLQIALLDRSNEESFDTGATLHVIPLLNLLTVPRAVGDLAGRLGAPRSQWISRAAAAMLFLQLGLAVVSASPFLDLSPHFSLIFLAGWGVVVWRVGKAAERVESQLRLETFELSYAEERKAS